MPRHSKERTPWRRVKWQKERDVRTEAQPLHITWRLRQNWGVFVDFLPLKRQLLDRSVIFHCHSKMASCATRETPAHEHFPLSNPVQSQHKNATYGPPWLPDRPIRAPVEPCVHAHKFIQVRVGVRTCRKDFKFPKHWTLWNCKIRKEI